MWQGLGLKSRNIDLFHGLCFYFENTRGRLDLRNDAVLFPSGCASWEAGLVWDFVITTSAMFSPGLLRARDVVWSQLGIMPLDLRFERIVVATAHYSLRKEGQYVSVRTKERQKQSEVKMKAFKLSFSNRFCPCRICLEEKKSYKIQHIWLRFCCYIKRKWWK